MDENSSLVNWSRAESIGWTTTEVMEKSDETCDDGIRGRNNSGWALRFLLRSRGRGGTMKSDALPRRVKTLERLWSRQLRPCQTCRDPEHMRGDSLLTYGPLPWFDGTCMLMCRSCRRLFWGRVIRKGKALLVHDHGLWVWTARRSTGSFDGLRFEPTTASMGEIRSSACSTAAPLQTATSASSSPVWVGRPESPIACTPTAYGTPTLWNYGPRVSI